MQPPYDKLEGVISTRVGYTDGPEKNPTYEAVSSGQTGHTEAIELTYDPKRVSYERLLEVFWRNIDPTDLKGQFVDRGSHYRPGIYYHTPEQRRIAEKSKKALSASKRFKKPIIVPIKAVSEFYSAEDYHQKYYKKSKFRYKLYRQGSGRDQFIEKHWPK